MSIIALVAAFIAQVRAAIAKLPTAESLDANGEVSWSLRNLAEAAVRLEVQFPALKGVTDAVTVEAELNKQFATVLLEAGKTAVDEAEKAGTVIPKTAHTVAVDAAEAKGKAEALKEFQKTAADNAEAATKRGTLIAAGLPAPVAEKIPVTVLVGDNAEANVATITKRVTALKAVPGIKPESEAFTDCAEALDEAGQKRFERMLELANGVPTKKAATDNAEAAGGTGNPADLPPVEKKPFRIR